MKEKEENIGEKNEKIAIDIINNNINNFDLFDKIIKRIDEDILKGINFMKNNSLEVINKIHNTFQQLFSTKENLFEIKNKYGNTLSQYYLSSGKIFLSLEIVKIYYKIYKDQSEHEKDFMNWLINDNTDGKNIFEIGIEIQSSPKDIIYFYKQLFETIENFKNNYIIYRILEKRKENIFILSIKEDKYFLLLFLYEKIKKYYPSSNPLNIKNKLGLAPLHFSCYYLSRLTPSDYAKKYGNSAMINLFTKNPFNKIVPLKDKKFDKFFILFLFGCVLVKYGIYNSFWKSFISDFLCLISFLYIIIKSKNYYLFNYEDNKKDSTDITYESLFEQCNFNKNKIKKICSKCKIIKKFGTIHCIVCDSCVENFDHHCYWINKCINSKIIPEFITFLIITLICLVINLYVFYFEFKRIITNKNISKDFSYYFSLIAITLYLFIFGFGIAIITSLLYERLVEKIKSKKKITLEENLLNKKNYEEENEKHNCINNSNNDK